jgi:DNA segregation ATPase FtsK/SpoIIIE, S-DNA-T family
LILKCKVVDYHVGPAVTQYELEVKSGTKVNRIVSLNREIALELAAKDVRIQAPIPGKKTIGIEIPNRVTTMVTLRDVFEKFPRSLSDSKLAVVLGKNIMGEPIFMEINNTPHLLVAGATGSGKSVCINSIIVSLLMRTKPDEVKLVLIDPKKVELSMYNGVPHLLAPVVTDPKRASGVLQKIVSEMDRRYELFNECGTKSLAGYNFYIDKKNKFLPESEHSKKLPYIVIIVDELADLMTVAAKEVEQSILRITQMARAAGIHLIVATQRPSTDVITGLIKSNLPSRIAFAVSSSIDSRTILDMSGAEKLLGKGDMLFSPSGSNSPQRIQGTFISDEEISSVIDFTVSQQKAKYDEKLFGEEA